MTVTTIYKSNPTAAKAIKLLKGQGFALPDRPTDEPSAVLGDVSSMGDEELIDEFVLLTAWTDFAAAQTGIAVIAEKQCERLLDEATGTAWKKQYADHPKTPVTVAREIVADDAAVHDARVALEDAYAYRRLVSDLTARYERDAAALSRELTRRTSDKPMMKARKRWET